MTKSILITDNDLTYILQKYNNFLNKNEITNNILNTFNTVNVEIEVNDDYDLCVKCNVTFNNNLNNKLIINYYFTPDNWCQISNDAYIDNDNNLFYCFNNDSVYSCSYHPDIYEKYNIPIFCKYNNNARDTLMQKLSEEVRPIYYQKLEDEFWGIKEE